MEKNRFDATKNGVCTGCGHCCGILLPLTNADKVRIHKHLKTHLLAPYEGTLMDCPFLCDEPGKRCRIYEVRPLICQEYVCNKMPTHAEAKRMQAKKMKLTDMRKEFFGGWLQ